MVQYQSELWGMTKTGKVEALPHTHPGNSNPRSPVSSSTAIQSGINFLALSVSNDAKSQSAIAEERLVVLHIPASCKPGGRGHSTALRPAAAAAAAVASVTTACCTHFSHLQQQAAGAPPEHL